MESAAISRSSSTPSRRELLVPPDRGGVDALQAQAESLNELSSGREPLTAPTLAVVVLNRLAFGPRPGDVAAFDALGADDDSRLAAWVAQQTAPDPVAANDTEYWQRRNGLAGFPSAGLTTLDKSLNQLWLDHEIGNVQPSRPVEETRLDSLSRMVYSRWQFREVLVDFWMNHFNVYGFENIGQETFVHYDREVIRPHVFGNFRDLLAAVARSTSMLYYLDNYTNTAAGPNENWARELFELHTLGAENYVGVGQQASVPTWPDPTFATWPVGTPSAGLPVPAGYVDADVYEAARCFTGWGVASASGLFSYTAGNHDRFQKAILSQGFVNLPADQVAEKDGEDVLDLLAAHPGTGRYVARKLCRRLVADDPPETLVNSVASLFTSTWQATDQLRQVVTAIVLASEFRSTWGAKIKRPVDFAVSAMRAASANWQFGYTSQNPLTVEPDTASFLSRLSRTGQTLFGRVPPDGYPDREEAWVGTNTRLQCWRLGAWLIDQDIDGSTATDDFRLDVLGQVYAAFPSHLASSNQLVDFWIDRIFGRALDTAVRAELVDFMAQGSSPSLQLNLDTSSTVRSRVRSLVALMFMTPDFFLK